MPTLTDITQKAVPILRDNNATEAYVFGSVARNEAGPESDVDILVRFGEPRGGLFEFHPHKA